MYEAFVTNKYRAVAELMGRVMERPGVAMAVTEVSGGERIGAWIREKPEKFARIIAEFDGLIEKWNTFNRPNPEVFKCSAVLKDSLEGRQLPPLLPKDPTIANLLQLYRTVRDVANSMAAGQREKPPSYAYKFHLQEPPLTDEALVVGSLFHAYETLVGVQDPKLAVKLRKYSGLEKNYILDSLVEMTITQIPTNPLFREVVEGREKGHLDWVYGYPAFSQELQSRFVAKENWTR